MNDATAWAILAFVVAIARSSSLAATAFGLGLVIVFVAVKLFLVRPQLPRWLDVARMEADGPSRWRMAAVLLLILTSALATELIGIHALFGAFVAGVVMPQKTEFREYLIVRLENFSSLFLLPLFFAYSGLRTQVGLLNDPTSWLICLVLIGVATLGKLGGTMVTARLTGMNWNDSFALGALMNTRGLVELVALNIGYDLGICRPYLRHDGPDGAGHDVSDRAAVESGRAGEAAERAGDYYEITRLTQNSVLIFAINISSVSFNAQPTSVLKLMSNLERSSVLPRRTRLPRFHPVLTCRHECNRNGP